MEQQTLNFVDFLHVDVLPQQLDVYQLELVLRVRMMHLDFDVLLLAKSFLVLSVDVQVLADLLLGYQLVDVHDRNAHEGKFLQELTVGHLEIGRCDFKRSLQLFYSRLF